MTSALLIIDYSNDFINNKGSLTCGAAGQALDQSICGLIVDAVTADDFIFICNDHHQANDPYDLEEGLFPAHNIAGTWGCEIFGKTGELCRELLINRKEKTVYLPKLRYSAFASTALDAMLRARKVDTLTVCGVCTDICVLHTVIFAQYLGYTVKVKADACATIIPGGQE